MNMSCSKTPVLLLCLLLAHFPRAQDAASIRSSVDRNQLYLGEPLELTIKAHIPAGSTAAFPRIDTIDHFEFLSQPVIDSVSGSGGTDITAIYKLTSFDSGSWHIPAFVMAENIRSDSLPVEVAFSPFDPNQPYHDLKDVVDVKLPAKKTPWWWYAAGGLLLAALLTWLALKKKPAPAPAQRTVTGKDPYEEAMQDLQKLAGGEKDVKQYYSRLAEIFRLYVYRRKGILSLQKTTDDLALQLRELVTDRQQFDRLSQALRLSDFVKFARYIPTDEDNRQALEDIRSGITLIERSSPDLKNLP